MIRGLEGPLEGSPLAAGMSEPMLYGRVGLVSLTSIMARIQQDLAHFHTPPWIGFLGNSPQKARCYFMFAVGVVGSRDAVDAVRVLRAVGAVGTARFIRRAISISPYLPRT